MLGSDTPSTQRLLPMPDFQLAGAAGVAPLASDLRPALIGATSALVVAIIAALLGFWRYLRERGDEQRTLLHALFGELANLFEHYTYAEAELKLAAHGEQAIRLKLSMYGQTQFASAIDKYGFLSVGNVRSVLQLQLRIRNVDLVLERLNAAPSIPARELDVVSSRMKYILATTRKLMDDLAAHRPKLAAIRDAVYSDLVAQGLVAQGPKR